ncbi:hypothetical protein GHT06_012997 [Daphnia sinensis]|uniref:Transmembrane protein n=1 Tax=Daphnia sinensis TaxID=1820382 RepID=A0AAD5KX43_9CRUS|nr:hypothetical protein GHT06_012997 [Daphnia sinensis]
MKLFLAERERERGTSFVRHSIKPHCLPIIHFLLYSRKTLAAGQDFFHFQNLFFSLCELFNTPPFQKTSTARMYTHTYLPTRVCSTYVTDAAAPPPPPSICSSSFLFVVFFFFFVVSAREAQVCFVFLLLLRFVLFDLEMNRKMRGKEMVSGQP